VGRNLWRLLGKTVILRLHTPCPSVKEIVTETAIAELDSFAFNEPPELHSPFPVALDSLISTPKQISASIPWISRGTRRHSSLLVTTRFLSLCFHSVSVRVIATMMMIVWEAWCASNAMPTLLRYQDAAALHWQRWTIAWRRLLHQRRVRRSQPNRPRSSPRSRLEPMSQP
jgi:hypothetical protein